MEKIFKGKVKWLNLEKGYGFILCMETRRDIFFHVEQVMMEGMIILQPGTLVEFQKVKDKKGEQAINVYVK